MLLKRWLIITALLICVVFSAAGYTDRALHWGGTRFITDANADYLENAFDKSLAGFMLLSSIKSVLAVVEGSEVGVGFNLELGDVVQPVYDYVDIAWKAALAGGSIIVGMQLALKALTLVDHWALTGLLLLVIFWNLSKWLIPGWNRLQNGLRESVRIATFLTIAFYFLLPLSVTGASALSHYITRPMIEDSYEELEQIKSEISPGNINQQSLSDLAAGSFDSPSLKKRVNDTVIGIQMLISFLKTETSRIAALTFKLIAAYAFDCILFPLFFGLILTTMIRGGVQYFFDVSRLQPA